MSHVKYSLLYWGRASKTKITDIDKLMNRALKCKGYKGWNESVNSVVFLYVAKNRFNLVYILFTIYVLDQGSANCGPRATFEILFQLL